MGTIGHKARYDETALTVNEQIDALLSKGMLADREQMSFCLGNVSYHRLSGYWHPYRQTIAEDGSWVFRAGTKFADVWDRYVFDRQLRLLVFDAIERVEVAIRDDLILALAVDTGPFGYLDDGRWPNLPITDNTGEIVLTHQELLSRFRSLCRRELRNGTAAVVNFVRDYGDVHGEYLPYWILTEIVDFGTLGSMLKGAPTQTKKQIAHKYGIKTTDVIDSWMSVLRAVRNGTAHHLRFWNIRHSVKPIIPNRKNSAWHEPVDIESVKDRAFGTLTILRYLIGYIAPQSGWDDRLEALFAAHPDIDRQMLGYPENWQDCPIWRSGKIADETLAEAATDAPSTEETSGEVAAELIKDTPENE